MRIGIDIGGTFTDLVAAYHDRIEVAKVASTPSDPSRAFLEALRRVAGEPDEVRHGTTVATNAVLTRSGARLAFVTTDGFRHLLHLARQDRPSLYDLRVSCPAPLVDADRCVGVPERIGPDGTVLRGLDEDALRTALDGLDVDGVCITLLHSYANPEHEHRAGAIVREVLGDVGVSLSSDVLPEFREYERASTTALNAYVQPVVEGYLAKLRSSLGDKRLGVMWSGGGVRGVERTIDEPVHTLLSGPAAGVLAAAWVGARCGMADLVTVDVGGTSADVAIVDSGVPLVAESSTLDGLPFRTPTIDVISVGAGGGSIGWVDDGGALRVGPRSAGAEPGPVCYGLGGTEATVTDAHVVLGHLGAEGLAGGELSLDADAAAGALDRLGADAGLDRRAAAHGVLRVVRATMARAIRSVSIERGRDVRDHALVAFGGAGPLHGVALARELGIRTVIVPPVPGALAALGLLVASRRSDASVSRPMSADAQRDPELVNILEGLAEQALAELEAEGVTDCSVSLAVDCRYEGQSHELRIPVSGAPSFEDAVRDFEAAHARRYGFARSGIGVEAVTFRATALGPPGEVTLAPPRGEGAVSPVGTRSVDGDEVPVFERASLPVGERLDGPAIVIELDSTTWVEPGVTATVDDSGALLLEVR